MPRIVDQAAALGGENEHAGAHRAACAAVPAHQGFDAEDRPGAEIDDRLVLEIELAGFEAATDIGLQLEAPAALVLDGGSYSTMWRAPVSRARARCRFRPCG